MTTALSGPAPAPASHWRRYRSLYLLIAVCTAPVIASYLMYYVFPPGGRTNYGELIAPQRPLPALDLRRLDGATDELQKLRGNWVMIKVGGGACDEPCRRLLWQMRQLRTMQGKDADRIERVFLVADAAAVEPTLVREIDGTHVLRADRTQLERWLPAAEGGRIDDHVFLVDPIGNLMLRWPKDADPNRMKRDLSKLLKASRIG